MLFFDPANKGVGLEMRSELASTEKTVLIGMVLRGGRFFQVL